MKQLRNIHLNMPHLKHGSHCIYKRLHTPAHMAYFILVAIESHGTYGIVAGGLFVLSIIGLLSGEIID